MTKAGRILSEMNRCKDGEKWCNGKCVPMTLKELRNRAKGSLKAQETRLKNKEKQNC